ncbi:MAG: hypothetical protein Q9221_007160 [Calogaya cf. arnoldii]
MTATYSLLRSQMLPAMGILAVNRQARFEALPIFYGENCFHFFDMGAIIPFLKDRSLDSRQQIRHLGLSFDVNDPHDGFFHYQIGERAKALAYVARRLRLRKLTLYVNDGTLRFEEDLISDMQDEEWIQTITRIYDLDRLTFDLDFEAIGGYCEALLDDEPLYGATAIEDAKDKLDGVHQWVMDTEDGYRDYLKSRMLKKKQTQLDRWLKRHVCDIQCENIAKGRAATKNGLPCSDSRGQWMVPDVDLDALYAELGADPITSGSDVDDWSDEYSEGTVDDHESESDAPKVNGSRKTESASHMS